MSRMSHVMQVGAVEGNIRIYMEDYAYTYLKKQRISEKSKYFLYGEREAGAGEEKIYIYGIAEAPKLERSYFKEYYPIGYLRIQKDEKYWVDMKGREHLIKGFFVFYAPNQAMQEYLIDKNEQGQPAAEKEPEQPRARRILKEMPSMKETLLLSPRTKVTGKTGTSMLDKMMLPAGFGLVIVLILVGLSTSNGQKKLQIFKDVIAEAMSDQTEELIVEEGEASDLQEKFEIENQGAGEAVADGQAVFPEMEEAAPFAEETTEEAYLPEESMEENGAEEDTASQEPEETSSEILYISYTVEEGDTLASICQKKYGSLNLMSEICALNNIKNPDHISPGQKLYLPNK